MPDYEAWKENLGGKVTGWEIQYYKGLGTSSTVEGKEYFRDLNRHKKDFIWVDEQDGDAIEMAFSKKKAEDRKKWLRQYEPGTCLDQTAKLIKYSDFVNKELILFSMADLERSIPSMVDGLKPGQRKILFCAFKRNLTKKIRVAQFAGYVSEKSAYHHGGQSLCSTIVGMAQNFVASNNINVLVPEGMFGTRLKGGKDHASPRYINTLLSPITRCIFPKDDEIILDYLNEDGQSIEPTWYMPILPMVLVNGSEGIGTGWSSYIPNYNPRDIVRNLRRLLNDEPVQAMDPWYNGFKGLIEKTATKEVGATYTISGIIEEVDTTTLRITELPVRAWTSDYKEFLESLITGNDKIKEPFIKDFRDYSDVDSVNFDVILSEENMNIARQEGLLKKFKLTTNVSTSNMHLFDSKGVIKKYESPEQILEEFYHLRLEFYGKRLKVTLSQLELDLMMLDNKVRFILGVVRGEIIVNNRKKDDLFLELQQKGFTPFPKKSKGSSDAVREEESDEDHEPESEAGRVKGSDYDYLLSMAIRSLTLEKVQELCQNKLKLEHEVEELKNTTPQSVWLKALDAFEAAFEEHEKAEEIRREEDRKANNAAAVSRKAQQKKPTNKNARKVTAESVGSVASVATDKENVPKVAKPRGASKKAPTKKATVIESDEEESDEEILELKDRLAKYKLDSSPDQTAMETEVVQGEPSKKVAGRRAAASKKAPSTLTDISDDEDEMDQMSTIHEDDVDDGDFEMEASLPATKGKKAAGGGGKKPTTNSKAKTTTTTATARKRGGGGVQSKPAARGQKLITEVLRPVENVVNSPEKKVRKMRASPFNKKSGSVLGRTGSSSVAGGEEEEEPGHSSSVSPLEVVRDRPQRGGRNRGAAARYVVSSSSEGEEEEPVDDDDSDFGEEED